MTSGAAHLYLIIEEGNETTTGETARIIATVELGEAGLTGLRMKVEKLNKRAERHGMNKLSVRVVRKFTVESNLPVNRYDVEIDGCAPCINGWYLAARIENNEIAGTIVRVVPGKFKDCDYSAYRTHDYSCDHCNTKRRRNDVFVLADDNGQWKVVGRNCLADFLRCKSAEGFAEYAEMCDAAAEWDDESLSDYAREEGFGGKNGYPVTDLVTFMTAVATCTRKLGWTSRSAAYDNPGLIATSNDAYFLIFGSGNGHVKFVKDHELYVSDGDTELAGKAVKWAESLEEGKSEYLATIAKIGTAGAVNYKLAGFAASIIRAYQKDCEWAAERAEKEAGAKEKVYIGSVGERLKGLVVTVKRVRYFEGSYGTMTIVAMEADLPDGKVAPITWFASGDKEFDEGSEYTLSAGIKGHEDKEKYGKQTIITRAKLIIRKGVAA